MRRIDYKQERRKRRARAVNHWIVAIIIILGIAMVCVLNMDHIESFMANYVQTVELGKTNKNSKLKKKVKANFNYQQVKPVSPSSIAQAFAKSKDYQPVGQLAIDGLNVHQNVYEGVGNVELNLGLGTLKPHQKMGRRNYALAGHNMNDNKSYLSPLYGAENNNNLMGQAIYITDFKNVYFYKVIEARFISKYDTELISDHGFGKSPVITLITCDATGAGRLYVLGSYTGQMSLDKAPNNVQKSFIFK